MNHVSSGAPLSCEERRDQQGRAPPKVSEDAERRRPRWEVGLVPVGPCRVQWDSQTPEGLACVSGIWAPY